MTGCNEVSHRQTGRLISGRASVNKTVMFYVEVEDIAAHIGSIESMESMESRGGQVMVPESGSFAWCKDPNGNLFGLWIPAH